MPKFIWITLILNDPINTLVISIVAYGWAKSKFFFLNPSAMLHLFYLIYIIKKNYYLPNYGWRQKSILVYSRNHG